MICIESLHNAILDRPWIHMMKDVPSSFHQLLRYRTLMGTTNIRGVQAMAQSIVVIAQKKSGWTTKSARVATDQDHPQGKKQKQIATQ